MNFSQNCTSVLSMINATPSDLEDDATCAQLIVENKKKKLDITELPKKTLLKPLVCTGPSGVGKKTLLEHL